MNRLITSKTDRSPEAGQGLVEYALILVLVAVVVIVILSVLGPSISWQFAKVASVFQCSNYATEFGENVSSGELPDNAFLMYMDGQCSAGASIDGVDQWIKNYPTP